MSYHFCLKKDVNSISATTRPSRLLELSINAARCGKGLSLLILKGAVEIETTTPAAAY
ncbi:hypothetical protein [Bradyrhizobium sp. MOS003]|uniref:hypothetical protein n=1 Tax=Bradyrhizobium sp. MOS003 TaxID=2133946 RepID=UPI001314AEFB|nr:hypothetical protein [Bradyrhizobium sp. MOS003]